MHKYLYRYPISIHTTQTYTHTTLPHTLYHTPHLHSFTTHTTHKHTTYYNTHIYTYYTIPYLPVFIAPQHTQHINTLHIHYTLPTHTIPYLPVFIAPDRRHILLEAAMQPLQVLQAQLV